MAKLNIRQRCPEKVQHDARLPAGTLLEPDSPPINSRGSQYQNFSAHIGRHLHHEVHVLDETEKFLYFGH